MRILHLSDLHVQSHVKYPHRMVDQAEVLGRLVDQACDDGLDLALLTGDLYGKTAVPHRPSANERAVLEPLLVQLAQVCPVVVIPGNHDHGPTLQRLPDLGGLWPIYVPDRAQVLSVATPGGVAYVYAVPYPTKRWLLAGEEVAGRTIGELNSVVAGKLSAVFTAWASRIARKRKSEPDAVHVLAAHVAVRGCSTSGGEVLSDREIEVTRGDLEAMPVDYGALGHLHLRQEPAFRCWYPGSPYYTDHGELEASKHQHRVEIGPDVADPGGRGQVYRLDEDRHPCAVQAVDTGARSWCTLHWRWASTGEEDAIPEWIERPTDEELAVAAGAEVRCRVTVADQHLAGMPWAEEQARVDGLAHHVVVERSIEANHRVRAPELADARTLPDRCRVFWGVQGTAPSSPEALVALDLLEELQADTDPEIQARSLAMRDAATVSPTTPQEPPCDR